MQLSIVTIHLNDFAALERTLKSLELVRNTIPLEWIVVDGGSELRDTTKGIIELVKARADQFTSEPDEGIYHAMNKGTALANGDYILYLNAGDELHPSFSWAILQESIHRSEADMIWGRADVRDRTGRMYPRKTRQPLWLTYGMAVSHQAIFFKRSALDPNPYDVSLQIAADYELICKLYNAEARIQLVDLQVCIFDLVGKSSVNKRLTLGEESFVRGKYFKVPELANQLIVEFKNLIWRLGTFSPTFRRIWSRFF